MTRFSTSLAVDAATYVRPFITVSMISWVSVGPLGDNTVGRIMNVKVKRSSVSLSILRRKFGMPAVFAKSGS